MDVSYETGKGTKYCIEKSKKFDFAIRNAQNAHKKRDF